MSSINIYDYMAAVCYKLDDNKNVVECSIVEWGEYFSSAGDSRVVGATHVGYGTKKPLVSTVFIGMSPTIFETMVFGGNHEHEDYTSRTNSWNAAKQAHEKAVKMVLESLPEHERHEPVLGIDRWKNDE